MFNYIKNRAFTVAETMIVLIILGTLFTVIIPVTLNKHRENINRIKIKKSMAYYEVVFKKLVVDNHIMTDKGFKKKIHHISQEGDPLECGEIRKQFKIIEEAGGNRCIFRSAEDVWWDVSDFTAPKISIKKENISDASKNYTMSGHIDNGVLRINDMGYITNATEKAAVQKIYNCINKIIKCE